MRIRFLKQLLPISISIFFLMLLSKTYGEGPQGLTSRILEKTDNEMLIEISVNNYSIVPSPDQLYKSVNIYGCGIIDHEGYPGVAVAGELIETPEHSTVELITQPVEIVEYNNVSLAPVPQKIVLEDERGEKVISQKYVIDSTAYKINSYIPGELAKIDYTGYMRDKAIARLLIYPTQYNPVTKRLIIHKKINVRVKFHALTNIIPSNTSKNIYIKDNDNYKKSIYDRIYSSCLLNNDSNMKYSVIKSSTSDEIYSNINPSAQFENTPFAVRATIENEGIYKVTYEDLNALGVNLSSATNENLKIENQGKEISVYRSGTGTFKPGDFILFYGIPFKSLYTKKNVYWIYQGSDAGKKMSSRDGSAFESSQVKNTFNTTYHSEEDKAYWETIPNGDGVDHWFWQSLTPTETSSASANFTAPISNYSSTNGNFSMKINLRGKTTPNHHTKAYINGNQVADFTWSGQIELTKGIDNISPTLFNNGNNTIRVEEILDSGTTVDTVFVNWFEVYYVDTYVAENNILKCNGQGNGSISLEIKNFNTNDILIFDTTDALNVAQVVNMRIDNAGSTYSAKYGDSIAGTKTYYALTAAQMLKPTDLTVDEPSNLKSQRTDIDYIIITHDDFYDKIQALKDYRESNGLHVEVVKIQDVYDEFSYGLKDARAIKDFLTYAYNNWHATDHPTYVLLVGGASIDYRDDTGNFESSGRVDFVPTYLFQTPELGDTPTDNWFVCVNGSDPIPDMIIGRLSVKTTDDLNNIIDKIKAYEPGSAGTWTKNVIFASDNDQVFVDTSDRLAALLPENYTAEKVYLNNYATVEVATTDLVNKINSGSLITNYTGHGSVNNWAGEFLFHTPDAKDNIPRNDVDRLTNGSMLTFVMTLNCLNGFFPNFVNDYCLAEDFVRAKNKGAIACLAPTGLGYTSEHEVLAEEIFKRLFQEGDNIAGSVYYTGKINAYNKINSEEIIQTFTLFGDPATHLKTTASNNSSIKLSSPVDNMELKRNMISTFSWEGSEDCCTKYKIQFSKDAYFPDDKTIITPLYGSKYITDTEYTPKLFIWIMLNLMSKNNGSVYWRVAGYDESNQPVQYSEHRSFTITK